MSRTKSIGSTLAYEFLLTALNLFPFLDFGLGVWTGTWTWACQLRLNWELEFGLRLINVVVNSKASLVSRNELCNSNKFHVHQCQAQIEI